MKLYLTIVTPAQAEQWLLRNKKNRVIRQRRVDTLARSMAAGKWRTTGDTVKFSLDGSLLDGQHRLLAIIQSGMPCELAVAEDLEPEAQMVVDTHAKRTFADVLKLKGEPNAVALAAALHALWQYENGSLRNNMKVPSHDELLALLDSRPDMRTAISWGSRLQRVFPGPLRLYTLAYLVTAGIDEDDANFFFERLIDGVGLDENNAILACRRWLENIALRRIKVNSYEFLGALFKAWNAYRQGTPLKILMFKTGGARPEQFPQPA